MTSDPLGRVPRNERRPNTTNQAEDTHVKITNYRKNGEKFQNLLTMRPVLDGDGLYRYVIGVQFELTDDDSLELRRVTTCCWFLNACPVGDVMFIYSGPPVNKNVPSPSQAAPARPRRAFTARQAHAPLARAAGASVGARTVSRFLAPVLDAVYAATAGWPCERASTPAERLPPGAFRTRPFSCDDGHLAPRQDAPMRLPGNRT